MSLDPFKKKQARDLCLQALFQIEFSPQISIADFLTLFEETFSQEILQQASEWLEAVKAHREEIDRQIQSASQHWKVERMGLVDRNALRLAVFEMHYSQDKLKPAIAINEAVELVKKYGSQDSASFVNGVLDSLAKSWGYKS